MEESRHTRDRHRLESDERGKTEGTACVMHDHRKKERKVKVNALKNECLFCFVCKLRSRRRHSRQNFDEEEKAEERALKKRFVPPGIVLVSAPRRSPRVLYTFYIPCNEGVYPWDGVICRLGWLAACFSPTALAYEKNTTKTTHTPLTPRGLAGL